MALSCLLVESFVIAYRRVLHFYFVVELLDKGSVYVFFICGTIFGTLFSKTLQVGAG